MGFFDFLHRPGLEEGLARYNNTPGAVLLEVRTPAEYAEGHLPGSRNLPLQVLEQAGQALPDRETPVFVYCRSGARSHQAQGILRQMGFTRVEDIGGLLGYHGKLEQ